MIDKISEVDGEDDGGYADPAAGSETDGGVEEKPLLALFTDPGATTRQCAHAFYYATLTICKSQRRV